MKNKYFLVISTMMVTAALILSATAQSNRKLQPNTTIGTSPSLENSIPFGTQVKLHCKVGTPVEFPTVTITNDTKQTVPAGRKAYWQANSVMKGFIILSAPLAPGKSVKTSAEAAGTSYNPVAWYFK